MATILVVDDVPENRTLLSAVLGWEGHRLIEASDGRHALAILDRAPVDLVITDLLMPGMDGFELSRHLAARAEPHRPRILFYSATYNARDAMALGRLCGVAGLIEKPADPDVVVSLVAAALSAPLPPPQAGEGDFEREHARLLTAHVSDAISQKRVTAERLRRLQGFGAQLLAAKSPSAICRALCTSAREMALAADAAVGVYPLDGDQQGLIVRGVLGGALFERAGFRPDPETEPSHAVEGESALPVATRMELTRPGNDSLLAVPVDTPARRHGWLCVGGKVGGAGFSVEDGEVLAALTVQAAIALENAHRLERLTAHTKELSDEIAERRRAERMLLEAEARTRFALESTHVGLWEIELATGVLSPVSALEPLAAHAGRPLVRSVDEFLATVDVDDRDRVRAALERVRHERLDFALEFRTIAPDGSVRWREIKAHVVCEQEVPVRIVGVVADVTERRTLEAQLREAQKMEAVGQLAGGIAHDFNNMLTAIVGYSDLLTISAANDDVRADVGEIRKAADRAAALTRQLLAFSRRQVLQPSVVDVADLVEHLIPMLRRLIGEDIELRLNAAPQLRKVCVDPSQLEQVLLNLVVNARDAMPQGGSIAIDLTNAILDADYCGAHEGMAPGPHVCIAVTDTGTGMDGQTLKHLFEPFFTTKPVGKGTGLGLATVHGIVKQSGGHVWVYSELGHGSTFKVYFPTASAADSALADSAVPEPPPRGWETVLLAEDEDAVRQYAGRVLRGLGYHVLEAPNGDAAIELAREVQQPIHLLLSDVVMPGANGPQVHARLASEHPRLKVLFMSGYPGDAIVARGFDEGCAFMEKPFSSGALARRVRDVLDGVA